MRIKWLYLGIIALALSGVFSCFVLLLRLPFFVGLIPNIFDVSLIIHVTLGINVWMLAITVSTWDRQGLVQRFSYNLCFIAVILIFLSGFIPGTDVIKSNYIPFLDNLPYITGVALLLFGILINSLDTIIRSNSERCDRITATIFLISQVCMCLAYARMPSALTLHQFHEYLCWGGGHILQFVFCQSLIIVFSILFSVRGSDKVLISLSWLNLLLILPTPLIYYYTPDNEILIQFFTYHMRIFGGIVPTTYILYLLFISKQKVPHSYFWAFALSASLFVYGGLLGFLIRESNIIIPAHYHGSIIGITVAFMAFAYHVTGTLTSKLSMIQLSTYTIGQFGHITGLLLMGGYGALRKSAGMTGESTILYKAIFMVGGTLSIFSGALFVILLTSKLVRRKSQRARELN
ncbi:cytochrome C and Quinol oxidase polypeptide I family protein [Neorickettsia helminthoeca str. Oregon]|uniref:Cytochrome C and Quinol oxidase polypeptide I family protein n=1 Tax=Neorickettsia helminthoeca str. Oregon TaxID=1286528 RepID=X5H326_9RICK|nr:hypothetical protein [Neorickettsia helminthoeca]AHX11078.1 cytochrome C and Quinol oxidase polypeptide I family protein [Neorickettsia helminthoeca str. Oregon]